MYYKYKDINMYYEKVGKKDESIIILPGWGDTRKTFDYMINFLKNYFTVYIVDYPGFGNSPFPDCDLTIFDYSELIYNFIKKLKIKKPIIIGHSFGGRIITIILSIYKYKFRDVIYIDSAGIKPKIKFKTRIYKFLKKLKGFIPKKYRSKYLNYLFKKFASNDYMNLSKNMQNTFKNIVNTDLKKYLNKIDNKVLIIWGNNDLDTPIKDAYVMHKRIKNSELIVLDRGSHFVYLDYPILINRILYEELKEYIK